LIDFDLPFGGKLRSDNRWVILSQQIPWDEVEVEYIVHFLKDDMGCPCEVVKNSLWRIDS